MSQLEVQAQEANNLRGKYGELLNDKQRYVVLKLWITLYNAILSKIQ